MKELTFYRPDKPSLFRERLAADGLAIVMPQIILVDTKGLDCSNCGESFLERLERDVAQKVEAACRLLDISFDLLQYKSGCPEYMVTISKEDLQLYLDFAYRPACEPAVFDGDKLDGYLLWRDEFPQWEEPDKPVWPWYHGDYPLLTSPYTNKML